ncbi:MAG: GFA family protein [Acidihalobacter sp.]|uniref:GFA family protein n=1 Tax=Acidihalobacter sp. TaxID=1872108 RepID=UPI00307F4AA9
MSNPRREPYTGRCLCGQVSYAVDSFEPKVAHCHCSMCRKFHGAAFTTFASVRRECFRWVSGESLLKGYRAANGTVRKFCSNCGSSMVFVPAAGDGGRVEIALGTLDSELDFAPDAHIFVGSKANWDALCDELPKYVADRGSERVD